MNISKNLQDNLNYLTRRIQYIFLIHFLLQKIRTYTICTCLDEITPQLKNKLRLTSNRLLTIYC